MFKKLVKMLKVSRKLKIDDICIQLKRSREEVLKIFFDWGEKFGVIIDGDFIFVKNTDDLDSIVMDLLQQSFDDWSNKEKTKEGKINQIPQIQFSNFHGIMLIKSDFNFMLELEKIIDEPIPTLSENKIDGETFGFFALNNHVVGLGIYSKNLTFLPESIGSLKSLKELYLGDNLLTSLPESIGSLTSLKMLDLEDNELSSLPESFGSLTLLKELWLNDNQFASLPESIGLLKSLEILWLNNNHLSSLPESIGSLILLKELYLNSNNLSSLPESIVFLTSLEELYSGDNKLTSLPKSIGSLKSLKILDLEDNKLSSLPESIKIQLRTLEKNDCEVFT